MHCWANFPQILAAYDFKAREWNALETGLVDALPARWDGLAAASAASRRLDLWTPNRAHFRPISLNG
jgi:predicted nucleic acid-binding protein